MDNLVKYRPTLSKFAVVTLTISIVLGCNSPSDHPQDLASELDAVIGKLVSRMYQNSLTAVGASPQDSQGQGPTQGGLHGNRPPDPRRIWADLSRALSVGLDCENLRVCPGKLTCSQILNLEVSPQTVNKRQVHLSSEPKTKISSSSDIFSRNVNQSFQPYGFHRDSGHKPRMKHGYRANHINKINNGDNVRVARVTKWQFQREARQNSSLTDMSKEIRELHNKHDIIAERSEASVDFAEGPADETQQLHSRHTEESLATNRPGEKSLNVISARNASFHLFKRSDGHHHVSRPSNANHHPSEAGENKHFDTSEHKSSNYQDSSAEHEDRHSPREGGDCHRAAGCRDHHQSNNGDMGEGRQQHHRTTKHPSAEMTAARLGVPTPSNTPSSVTAKQLFSLKSPAKQFFSLKSPAKQFFSLKSQASVSTVSSSRPSPKSSTPPLVSTQTEHRAPIAVSETARKGGQEGHATGAGRGGNRPGDRPLAAPGHLSQQGHFSFQGHHSAQERPPPSEGPPFNHSAVAARVLFGIAELSSLTDCSGTQTYLPGPRAWVDRVCSEMDAIRGGTGGSCYLVVQRHVHSLEARLLQAVEGWRPDRFMQAATRDGGGEAVDIVQKNKCFNVHALADSLAQRLRHVSVRSCHHDLHDFITRLGSSLVIRLLQGHRHTSSHSQCPGDFVDRLFGQYGVQDNGCSSHRLMTVDGLQAVLDVVTTYTNCSHHIKPISMEQAQSDREDWLYSQSRDRYHTPQTSHGNSRESRSTKPDISETIFSARQLVDLILNNATDSVTVDQFYQLCPAVLQQLLMASQSPVPTTDAAATVLTDDRPEEERIAASDIQTYGLGTATVAVMTLCSLLGAVVVKLCTNAARCRHYAMAALLGLTVGNLCGDVVLHLLPEAFGFRHYDQRVGDDVTAVHHLAGGFYVDDVRLKGLALLVSIYLFWVLEVIVCRLRHPSPGMGGTRRDTTHSLEVMSHPPIHVSSHPPNPIKSTVTETEEFKGSPQRLAWMIVAGDALHNLADGLAIGAAFARGLPLGLSTALVVICHEVPHEIGDFAVLVSTGMKMRKALLLNVLSSLTAFLGLYIGLGVGAHVAYRQWIFVVVSGTFLYVSLADLMPELIRHFQHYRTVKMFVVQSAGLLTGFAIMFVLVLVQEKLHF